MESYTPPYLFHNLIFSPKLFLKIDNC
uniref:Uncharacterized protein n=1 Tax=Arundo donax TaxID=35708 RepID=A0A0A8Z4H2_ARUDO